MMAGLALVAAAGAAEATSTVAISASYSPDFQNGSGGEFQAQLQTGNGSNILGQRWGRTHMAADLGGNTFQTFCLERSEGIGSSLRFTVNEFAVRGGNGGQDGSQSYTSGYRHGSAAGPMSAVETYDLISLQTKWLYWNFRNGTLDGAGANDNYRYGTNPFDAGEIANRLSDAGQLQNIFWNLETEQNVALNARGNAWLAAANAAVSAAQLSGFDPAATPWFYQVRVLNVFATRNQGNANTEYLANDGFRQSQLTIIPLPAGAGLAMAGMGVLAIRRRTAR